MPQCNIDAKGKAVRLFGGIFTLLVAILAVVLIQFSVIPSDTISWFGVAGMMIGGLFAIYEGRTGWCALRAMGIKTPL
jgi:protein-S-isoprenylcysteine O-methyltransferase Ste14